MLMLGDFMISFISSWVKLIISIYIFITLVEIILPSNNLKKYAKFVLGLIVLITILVPFFKLIDRGINVETLINTYLNYYNNPQDKNFAEEKYNREIIAEFKRKLIQRLEDEIDNKFDKKYTITELVINEDLNKVSFGKIEKIVLKKDYSTQIKPVDKVVIGNRVENNINDKESKEVINFFMTNFGIDQEAIKIER